MSYMDQVGGQLSYANKGINSYILHIRKLMVKITES